MSQESSSWGRVRSESPVGPVNVIVNKFETEKVKKGTVKEKKGKSDFQRSGSFRNKHKVKQQDSDMTTSTSKIRPSDPRIWRIRHFGHYDLQSVTVDRLSWQASQAASEQKVNKPTGASAASVLSQDGPFNWEKHSNTLVAACPAFCTEVGEKWTGTEGQVFKLRETLSQEKRLRLCSRERVVLDGRVPPMDGDQYQNATPDVFTVQSGLTYPFEFFDYGACYYRNFFFDKGKQ